MNAQTSTLGIASRITPEFRGTSLTQSKRNVVPSRASGIAITPTHLSSEANLPTLIPNPEARVIITNPLQTRATERNQR